MAATFLRVAHFPMKHSDGMAPFARATYHRAVARGVKKAVKQNKVDFFNTTETSAAMAGEIKRALGPEFRFRHRGEYLHGIRKTRDVRIRRSGLIRQTRVWGNGGSSWRDVRASWVNVQIRGLGGKRWGRWQFRGRHNSSGVQAGKDYSREANNVEVNRLSNRATGRETAALVKSGNFVGVSEGVDSNTDQKLEVWRDRYEAQTGMTSMWKRWQSAAGTHGRRLIDLMGFKLAPGIAGTWVQAKVLPDMVAGPRDDHRWTFGVIKVEG